MPDDPAGVRLLGGHCAACGRVSFPAQTLCPYCGAESCATRALSPHGVVEVCTTVSNRPPGYDGPLPFGFGVVELPDGIRIVARLVGGEAVRAGTPVCLTLESLGADADGCEVVTFAFAPSPGGGAGTGGG